MSVMKTKSRQVLAAFSAGMLQVHIMVIWGYPSVALPQMEQQDSRIKFTSDESSWFASLPLLMCIPCSVIGASVYEWIGPRRTMLSLMPLFAISTMVMALADTKSVLEAKMEKIILLSSRAIQGLLVAVLNPFIPLYNYEMTDLELRGPLLSLAAVNSTVGFLLCYISGCFLPWSIIALFLPLITLVPAFMGILFSPESPHWLARRGKKEEARQILKLLRCTEKEVTSELDAIKGARQKQDSSCFVSLKRLSKISNIKAIIVSSLNPVMKELGGYAVLSIYVVHIFNQAGIGLDPKWCSVVVGLTRLIFNALGSFMLNRTPRRMLLIVGNILIGTANAAIGIFFYLQSREADMSWLVWLPLTGFIVHMMGYATGVGPCTWTVAVETLPGPIRSVGIGIGTTGYAICSFTLTKTFTDMKDAIGLHGVFWFFAVGAFVYFAIVVFFTPETKDKTMKDIEEYWRSSDKIKKDHANA